jgi:hypothetical protein
MALKMWEMLNRSEKQKLGGNGVTDAKGFTSAVQVYQAVHGGSPAEAAVKAAERLKFIDINTRAELLDEIYELEGHRGAGTVPYLDLLPEHADHELTNAISDYRLVIVEGSGIRCVYWEGQVIDFDWCEHQKPWEFLWELTRAACRGRDIDSYCLGFGSRPLKERLQGLKRALKKSPEALSVAEPLLSLIRSADTETYRLFVSRDQIWQRRLSGDRWEYEFEGLPGTDKTE